MNFQHDNARSHSLKTFGNGPTKCFVLPAELTRHYSIHLPLVSINNLWYGWAMLPRCSKMGRFETWVVISQKNPFFARKIEENVNFVFCQKDRRKMQSLWILFRQTIIATQKNYSNILQQLQLRHNQVTNSGVTVWRRLIGSFNLKLNYQRNLFPLWESLGTSTKVGSVIVEAISETNESNCLPFYSKQISASQNAWAVTVSYSLTLFTTSTSGGLTATCWIIITHVVVNHCNSYNSSMYK